ncbi:MAG: alpha/beta hydrolase-fold protein [Bacteroidales bacterium]|jgi:enterochelin esterase-like enzyme|nr:alpha/beta hydrolase-fold protein [Bacteroidales bacterium]
MKKARYSLLLILIPSLIIAQESKVFDDLKMTSKILNGERKYALYLPPDYESSQRNYPVLYLLHGGGDDQTGWVQFGEVKHIADKAIREGISTPVIIVMPDANTGQRGYVNDVKGEWRYEDFFFEEFMPFIETTYRIKREKQYRAVAGLSMGGNGTLIYALHHPELFSAACPLSAGAGPVNIENLRKSLGNDKSARAEKLIEAYIDRYNIPSLIDKIPDDSKKDIRWFIDCGDDDFLYEGNAMLHIAMRKKEIPHEYRVRDGAHNWTYWRESLPEVLKFISAGFHR